jgi:hypothetical protein
MKQRDARPTLAGGVGSAARVVANDGMRAKTIKPTAFSLCSLRSFTARKPAVERATISLSEHFKWNCSRLGVAWASRPCSEPAGGTPVPHKISDFFGYGSI